MFMSNAPCWGVPNVVGSIKDEVVVSMPSSAKKKPEVLSAGLNKVAGVAANMLVKSMLESKAKPAP